MLGRGTRFRDELQAKDTVTWCGVTAQVGSVGVRVRVRVRLRVRVRVRVRVSTSCTPRTP